MESAVGAFLSKFSVAVALPLVGVLPLSLSLFSSSVRPHFIRARPLLTGRTVAFDRAVAAVTPWHRGAVASSRGPGMRAPAPLSPLGCPTR